ncbi:MAG: aminodeoxychorismate/anthranilate synthase component II [Dehalococcoidia bacterium]|jgi:anthranilate synthase/aminodeoxychorismate synthase-like glutamine amidotransferase|nr:aminodeoxychorismate/anthranilate synthase component II [Dehalococcoidia bacterium]
MLLLIDNYDSFTYNLFQYLSELGAEVEVIRNDKATVDELAALDPERVVVSPGPSTPDNAGISVDVIKHFAGKVPVLGVCLGHQCIAQAFGGAVKGAGEIRHGKTSLIHHEGAGVFRGLPQPFEAVRYHSLAVEKDTVPDIFDVTARTDNGIIMGIKHKEMDVEGVQFHPESIMTKVGKDLLQNFLDKPSPGN